MAVNPGLLAWNMEDYACVDAGDQEFVRTQLTGPELTSRHFLAWALDRKIDLVHIQLSEPTRERQSRFMDVFDLSDYFVSRR